MLNRKVKKVIAPVPWFGINYKDKNTNDLFPAEWIKLKHEIKYQY